MKKERILVPVDGSQIAENAFAKAIKIAKLTDCELDLLNVIDINQFASKSVIISEDAIYQMTTDAQKYLEKLKLQAKKQGLENVAYHVRYGNPKSVIAYDFIKDYQDSLIVLGATGLNAFERMLLGSVTEYVNQHALADVLVVRTKEK